MEVKPPPQSVPEWIGRRQEVLVKQRQALVDLGLTEDEVNRGMEPLLSFYAQLDD